MFSVIFARDEKNGIGKNGKIPWKCSRDMKRFQNLTQEATLICGKKTFDEMGYLKNRIVKIRRNIEICEGKTFIIGGVKLFNEALNHPNCEYVYETIIRGNFECDTFLDFSLSEPIESYEYDECIFNVYKLLKNKDEIQYLDLVKKTYNGFKKNNTLSIFGYNMRFNLINQFPLITTKKMFWKGIVEELLWFIRGETNSKILEKKGVNIWKANANENGELGPIYGYQWRNFGGDQLLKCIDLIKNQPNSRRIILSSWNCNDLDKMALPPCHILCQFYVEGKYLSAQMYQRSGDIGLDVPFNISSYSLLIYIIAKICDLEPKEFLYCLGDAHIYEKHLEPLKEQINKRPFKFPKLELPKKNIEDYQFEDFSLIDYKHHKSIKMDLIVD